MIVLPTFQSRYFLRFHTSGMYPNPYMVTNVWNTNLIGMKEDCSKSTWIFDASETCRNSWDIYKEKQFKKFSIYLQTKCTNSHKYIHQNYTETHRISIKILLGFSVSIKNLQKFTIYLSKIIKRYRVIRKMEVHRNQECMK